MSHLILNAQRRSYGLWAALASLLLSNLLQGSVSLGSSDVQVGGFFSQGYLYNSDNNFPTEDKGGTWDFRELAINASTTYGSHLRVGAQLFAQKFGNIGEDKVVLDWAVVDYNVSPEFGIRLGRVKYARGLYGESLDLDLVRPFVLLPYSVYNPVLRDFASAVNGGSIYGSVNAGKSSFDYKVFYGHIPMNAEKGVAEFYNNFGAYSNASGGVSQLTMDYAAGGQLVWNTPVNGLKFVYSYSFFKNLDTNGPFIAYPAANLFTHIPKTTWNTVSAEYALSSWTFAAEWQSTKGTIDYGAPLLMPTIVSPVGWDGFYASAAHRFSDKIEVGAYYSYVYDTVAASRSDPAQHTQDIALSLRYDLNEHVTCKLEVHAIDGHYQTFNSPRISNAAPANTSTLVAVKTTLSF